MKPKKKKQHTGPGRTAAALCGESDAFARAADLYLIILFFVFPLFPGFSGYTNITLSKFLFFLASTLAWLVCTLALCVAHRQRPRLNYPQLAALALLAVCLLSALCSPYLPQTFLGAGRYGGLLTIALYALVFLGVSLFTRPKLLHFYALGASVTLCCAVAALQLLGGNPLHLFPDSLGYADAGLRYSGVYLGTVGNMNLTDAFFCMTIPLFFVLLLREKRFWLLLPLLSALAVTVLAGGSGALVGLLAAALGAMLLLPKTRQWRIIFAASAIALAAAGLLLLWFWPGSSGTAYELSQILHGHIDDSFGSSRILIWRKCLELVPQRPLLGGGPDTLPLRLEIEFSRYVPETGVTLTSYVDNAHNVYLGWLVNCGALGLAACLALTVCCFTALIRRKGRFWEALLLSLLCAAVQAFFGLGLCLTEPIFFALLGLAAAGDP